MKLSILVTLPLLKSFMVFIPIRFPSLSNRGPPLFPWFKAASIWIKYKSKSYLLGLIAIFRLEIMPEVAVSENFSPSGLPTVNIFSPIFNVLECLRVAIV